MASMDSESPAALALRRRQSEDSASRRPYRRRAHQTAIQLGEYVYLEGGRIATEHERVADRTNVAFGTIWSINMDDSWNNETVQFTNTSRRNPPPALQATLWADEEENVYYRWGGSTADGSKPDQGKTGIVGFHPITDKPGVLEWKGVEEPDLENFNNTKATVRAASTQCGRVGYVIGGFGWETTDRHFRDSPERAEVPVPGIATFEMETGRWSNDSTEAIVPDAGGSLVGARAACAGDGEGSPLVVTIGGQTTLPTATTASNAGVEWVDMMNITFWDPEEQQWLYQEARGPRPEEREFFCAAGSQGEDSYEIFVYGGIHEEERLDDIYVLTIPGFQWFQVNTTISSPRRAYHTCTTVGPGGSDPAKRRQVLSSGGIEGRGDETWDDDPWSWSLGIFDMTDLDWKTEYDPDIGDYQTPDVIKEWYDDGGMDSISWSNDIVREKFTGESRSSPDPEGESNPEPEEDSSSGTPTGAIAGGVVGGVVGLALIGLIIWFFLRRRKTTNPAELDTEGMRQAPPAAMYSNDSSGMLKPNVPEADSRSPAPSSTLHSGSELPGSSPLTPELAGASSRYELPPGPTPQGRVELQG